ncbi:phage tail tape measure protein [Chromobacterium haemolyticum]|uniref:phage tail tape measure protein n=1 Tax=Chromobacterium haemolyticum TaxID=394935 RepID=UPI001746F28C|nr:phage tail tape measure protein [Chromobacterium haemolyticum]QOD81894.1 phage tail tape measure protein [Chromobacterium haemolyticum]
MDLIQFGIVLKAFDQMSGVFGSAAGKSMGAISKVEQRVSALSEKLERMGTKAMGDGALLTGLMQKPVAAFAQAEDAATGLKVAMLGAGGELDARFGKINKLATELGDKLPGTTADFQNMMTALVKQGISYDAILGGVGKSAAYLAVMLKKPPEQAAEFVARLQDATGTAEKDMMSLMDTIQRATYLGVNDNNMLQFYTKITPAMDVMKRKGAEAAKEMAPFAVMFDQAGMQGEAAGNALRKVVQLGMDLKKVNKANKDLASKGVKLDFTDGKGEFGGMGNVMLQLDKLKKLTTADQLKALKEIFGDDAETLQVLSIMINKGVDGYNDTVDRMAKQADLQRRVNEQLGTLKNLWDAASGTFTNTLAAFGEAVSPELKDLVNWLGDTSAKMSELIGEHPKLAKAAGLAIGAFGGVLLVGGALAVTLGTITRLSGYALGPLAKLGGLFGKKGLGGAAGKAAEAAAEKMGVQRVWVTNWPGKGFDLGDVGGDGKPGGKSGGKAGKAGGRLARLGNAIKAAPGALLAGGRVALAAPTLGAIASGGAASMIAAGGMVAGAGAAGYGAGTLINAGITKALTATNGGKERTLGTWLYDMFHKDESAKLLAPTPIRRAAPQPVPLNPVAATQSNAQGQSGKTVVPQVTLTYNPTLTIQGDPIPGTDSKFKALLNAHRDELLRMINQAVENKARAAY